MALDADLLRSSLKAISHKADQLAATFYDRLFSRYPEVRPLFEQTRMDEQRKKLIRSIVLIVRHVDNETFLVPYLEGLGRMHVAYGAQDAHYDAVGSCLLQALAETAGEQWSDELQAAWGDAYGVVAGVMKGAAKK